MAIRIGLWDCEVCGNNGNLGSSRECEKCGAPRPENVRFYLPDDAQIVTDKEKINQAKAGVDWVCAFCGTTNSSLNKTCENCSASKFDSDKKLQTKVYKNGQVPKTSEDLNKEITEENKETVNKDETKKTSKSKKKTTKKSKKILRNVLIGFGAVLSFFILAFVFTKEIQVTVVSKSWIRTIEVEENKQVQEGGWELPDGATLIKEEQKVHHYNKVQIGTEQKTRDVQVKVGEEQYVCGKKDLGNGYFEDVYCTRDLYETRTENYDAPVYRNDPVNKPYYTYSIVKGFKAEPLKTTGEDENARWPVVDLNKYTPQDSIATYTITVQNSKGKNHSDNVNFELWNRTKPNDVITAEKSSLFGFFIGIKE